MASTPALPIVTEADVRQRVGSASFGRATPYVGALDDLRREGTRLRAWCQGQAPEPYAVEATLGMGGIASADCSCPVGDGGRCKHVAALVLTYLRQDDVPEVEPFETALAKRSEDELRAIVREMVALHPELDLLVSQPAGETTVSARAVEREVRQLLADDWYEWGAAVRVGRGLGALVRRAATCAAARDWAGTVVICGAVIDGVATNSEWLNEDSGAVSEIVSESAAPLGACLASATDDDVRAQAAELLFHIVEADLAMGGHGLGDDALGFLTAHATDAEKAHLCHKIEAVLDRPARTDDWSRDWQRRELGKILISLSPDGLGADAEIRVLRLSGQTERLAVLLLASGRTAEALDTVRGASDLEVVAVAPAFVAAGHGAALDDIATARLDRDPDRRLVDWIKERARTRGDAALAQTLAERQFFAYPSLERYIEALALGRELGREAEVRDALCARLRTDGTYGLLTEALLHDGAHAEALRLVHAPKTEWTRHGERARMRLVVAEAVATTHPEDASQLFLDAAVDAVERRGRENYRRAAGLFANARAVYRGAPALGDWNAVAKELRDAYRGLPALLDEMTTAGLLPTR